MKLAYSFTRRQLGKVIAPIKVHSARLPSAFGLFYTKIPRLDRKLSLPPEMRLLIRERVAQMNVCAFCMDATRAALGYVTELTRERRVAPETFARLARSYSEREICEIVWLAASEHINNMTNIALNIHSDLLCDIAKKRRSTEGRRAGLEPASRRP